MKRQSQCHTQKVLYPETQSVHTDLGILINLETKICRNKTRLKAPLPNVFTLTGRVVNYNE